MSDAIPDFSNLNLLGGAEGEIIIPREDLITALINPGIFRNAAIRDDSQCSNTVNNMPVITPVT